LSLGFPASRRLRTRREFLHVQQKGAKIVLPSFIVLVRARADDRAARLGITVTRKFGPAVLRNRAKRLLREAFRHAVDLLPAGVDIVVIPKAGRLPTGLAGVASELDRAAPKLRREAARQLSLLAKGLGRGQTGGSTKAPPT
jgi:ribonuclease P protein component